MSKFKVLLVYPNLMLMNTIPIGMALLSGCLKEDGNEVKLFDTTFYRTAEKSNDELRVEKMQVRRFNFKKQRAALKNTNVYDDFVGVVTSYKPDLIAISVLDDTLDIGLNLAREIKSKQNEIPIIFGGVHAFFNAEKLIRHSFIDMVCIGEGEIALREISKSLKNNHSFYSIPNLWFKDYSGRVIKNHLVAPIDINSLPFEDFSIFEEQRFYRPMQGRIVKTLPISIDRGCPHQCSFCNSPAISKMYTKGNHPAYFRQKTIKRIYQELKYQLNNYDVEYLYFNSETILLMPIKKLHEFAEMYSEFQLPFWCQTRFDTVSEEKIKILKQMNCDRISVGLEHGNEEFRRTVLKKTFTNEQVFKAFKIFNKFNMKISVNNMLGFPNETRELIFDTIRLNRKIKSDSINGFVVQPYAGTEIYQYCIEKGLLQNNLAISSETPVGNPVVEIAKIPKEELIGLLRTFVLYVKMPKAYYPKIKIAEKSDEKGNKALDELRKILFRKYF